LRALPLRPVVFLLALAAVTIADDNPAALWQSSFLAALNAASAKDYAKAEQLFAKTIAVAERLPPGDARLGLTLNTLGLVYKEEKKYAEAEKVLQRSLEILEKASGPESLDAGNVNYNLASVLLASGHGESALPHILKCRPIYLKILGPDSLKAVTTLCMTGEAYRIMKKYIEAEGALKQCADAREASGGVENPELADALFNLGLVYQQEGRYALADPALKMAEIIREVTLGVTSPEFADALEAHAALLRTMGRTPEADKDDAMAAAVRRSARKAQ